VQKIILFLLLLVSTSVVSQTIVKGIVVNSNNDPIVNVSINVKRFSLQATSDSLGQFEIFVPPNKFLELSKEGYFTKSLRITQNIDSPFTFRLEKKQATKNILLVRGAVVDYQNKEPLVGATVYTSDVTSQTVTDISGKFEIEVNNGATLLIDYGRTESFLIEYGGEQVFELFKPAPSPTIGNQSKLSNQQFNKGNIHQPLQLLQSRVPGLMMSMGGGNNPFGRFATRIRGLSSLNGENPFSNIIYNTVDPLIVVDGVPDMDISILDPLTIQSMKVIKDGTAAQYGMRGASGVIEITTNKAASSGIQYHTFLGIDRLHQTMQFLDASSYKGANYGDDTDWFKAVSQKAYTHTHHLSLSKKQNDTAYQFSLLYKDAAGILKKQGYQRFQINGRIQQTAFEEKLKVEVIIRGSTQEDNYSQPLAFRYAQSYNPTAPIFDNRSQYGGYFEQAIFDYYNPVAMLDLNTSQGDQRQIFTKLSAQYQLFPFLHIASDYSLENNQNNTRDFFSKDSFWMGYGRNGFASQNKVTSNNSFFNTHLALTPSSEVLKLLKIGYQYQVQQQESIDVAAGDFLTDAFSFNNLSAAADFANGQGVINSNKAKQHLASFYAITQYNWQNTILVNAGFRIEGSSRLGRENRWGRFPFIAIATHLGKTTDSFWRKNNMQIRASYGITGNLPYTDYLSLKRYGAINRPFYYNGDFRPSYEVATYSNPYLAWEQKKEWSLGLSFQPTILRKKMALDIDVYTNKVQGIIQQLQNSIGLSYFGNVSRIKNKGIEAVLDLEVLRKRNLSWQTSFVMNTTISILENYPRINTFLTASFPNQRLPNSPSGGGCCKVSSVLVEDDSTIGDLFFLNFQNISADGQWVFEDADRDGVQEDSKDKVVTGNGIPDWTVGWNNSLRVGNFKLDLFFRGAFGHQVFNITRKLTENSRTLDNYNILASTFEGESARLKDVPKESSFYVEDASFIRLDNAQLSYTLNTLEKLPLRSLKFYVAANNIFTITGYKGWDPDFRLQSGNDVLAIGYEFRNLYLPTKSWVFGLKLDLK